MINKSRHEPVKQIHDQVVQWLKKRAKPTEVSFAMIFVASDLSLKLTGNKIFVMPAQLEGISAGIYRANDEDLEEDVYTEVVQGDGVEEEIRSNVSVH